MIELGVEPQRKSVILAEEEPGHYLILGDFGGRATEPLAVDRNNLDLAMAKLQVTLNGSLFRGLEDFHPDSLFCNLDSFREVDPAALGERMRGLLHDPRFQAVEAAWRGRDFVIRGGLRDDSGVRIHIVHLPKADAARDLLDGRIQALLGARKWRAVIGLYAFGPDAADIEFLGRVARLAADVGAPFIAEGSLDMGDLWEQFTRHSGSGIPGARSAPLPVAPALRCTHQRDRIVSIRRNAGRAGSCALSMGQSRAGISNAADRGRSAQP